MQVEPMETQPFLAPNRDLCFCRLADDMLIRSPRRRPLPPMMASSRPSWTQCKTVLVLTPRTCAALRIESQPASRSFKMMSLDLGCRSCVHRRSPRASAVSPATQCEHTAGANPCGRHGATRASLGWRRTSRRGTSVVPCGLLWQRCPRSSMASEWLRAQHLISLRQGQGGGESSSSLCARFRRLSCAKQGALRHALPVEAWRVHPVRVRSLLLLSSRIWNRPVLLLAPGPTRRARPRSGGSQLATRNQERLAIALILCARSRRPSAVKRRFLLLTLSSEAKSVHSIGSTVLLLSGSTTWTKPAVRGATLGSTCSVRPRKGWPSLVTTISVGREESLYA
jgi:hypothetical protein